MLAAILGVCLTASLPASDPAPPDRPNVVLVLIDDLGWADLGCQGSIDYRTPHIDRLAAEGARFSQAYAAAAICSPTRAAILTGRVPARLHVTDWIRARFQRPGGDTPPSPPTDFVGDRRHRLLCPPNPYWLPREELTLAEVLKAQGYATCHIGKWHLGDDAWYPEQQGFDENHGGCDYGQPPSYFDPYTNRKLPQGIPGLPPRREGEYLTDREADEAVGFIDRHAEQPFFLYLAPYAVHTPIQAKADDVAAIEARGLQRQRNARYAAMVQSVDDAVGRVMEALRRHELDERTLVVFSSDNGGLLGPTHNAPLRSGKGFPYEGGLRVPFLLHWPGSIAPNTVSEVPVSSIDVFPTVLAAAGIAPPEDRPLDGRSLWPILREEEWDREDLFWHFPHYRGFDNPPYSVVRSGPWKLIHRWEGPSAELYHLGDDPAETQDLAPVELDRVAELRTRLQAHLDEVGALRPRRNPDYAKPAAPRDPRRPRVLMLGDSISMAYHATVVAELGEGVDVFRPAENCEGTTKGVRQIRRWLDAEGGTWDVVHFNFGLHDLKRVDRHTRTNSTDPADPRQAELAAYTEQLRRIVEELKTTGAKLIFATTTPVPAGVRPHRDVEDPARYNAAARAIMAEHGVAVNDLFAVAEARIESYQKPRDVHFNAEGSRALGREVARVIRARLPED